MHCCCRADCWPWTPIGPSPGVFSCFGVLVFWCFGGVLVVFWCFNGSAKVFRKHTHRDLSFRKTPMFWCLSFQNTCPCFGVSEHIPGPKGHTGLSGLRRASKPAGLRAGRAWLKNAGPPGRLDGLQGLARPCWCPW